MKPLILCLAPVRPEMSHDKFVSYTFPNDVKEFVDLCDKLYKKGGLSMVELGPNISFLHRGGDNEGYIKRYRDMLVELRERCPDLLYMINYFQVKSKSLSISEELLFPFPDRSVVSFYVNSYYKDGKRYNIDHSEILESIEVWKKKGMIVVPIISTPDDINFLNYLIENNLLLHRPLVLFEFSGSGNLEPSPENYTVIKNMVEVQVDIIVACEGQYWDKLARIAIVNGDHVRIGLKDSIAFQSNEYYYDKALGIAGAFGRSVANLYDLKKILNLNT